MAVLSRSAFEGLKLKTREVPIPELGEGAVALLRELTGSERDEYEASIIDSTASKGDTQRLNLKNARARLVSRCLIDDKGERLYKDNEVHLLGKLPGSVLDRLFDAAKQLSGITDEDEDQLMGKLKNSPETEQNDYGSD